MYFILGNHKRKINLHIESFVLKDDCFSSSHNYTNLRHTRKIIKPFFLWMKMIYKHSSENAPSNDHFCTFLKQTSSFLKHSCPFPVRPWLPRQPDPSMNQIYLVSMSEEHTTDAVCEGHWHLVLWSQRYMKIADNRYTT